MSVIDLLAMRTAKSLSPYSSIKHGGVLDCDQEHVLIKPAFVACSTRPRSTKHEGKGTALSYIEVS